MPSPTPTDSTAAPSNWPTTTAPPPEYAAATGHPVHYQELDEANPASLGESTAYTWRLMRETGGRADIETTRRIHPTLDT